MLTLWILSVLFALEPAAPWTSTYVETAEAIADASVADPLFADDEAGYKTAAALISLGWFEGRLDPKAVGDHGRARGLFQVHAGPYSPEAAARDYLDDVGTQARVAVRMLHDSQRACRSLGEAQRWAWYASGSCGRGRVAASHRYLFAQRLLREHPPP